MLGKDLKSLDDATLVQCIQQRSIGWRRAFVLLVRRHRSDLLWRCRVRLANVQDAEDAVQETVLRAYRALDGFKGESNFRTWLFTIADNQCHTLDVHRKRYVVGDHLQELVALMDEAQRGEESLPNETAARVREVLEELPASARDVLMLRFFRELSIEEIAKTLGIGLRPTARPCRSSGTDPYLGRPASISSGSDGRPECPFPSMGTRMPRWELPASCGTRARLRLDSDGPLEFTGAGL